MFLYKSLDKFSFGENEISGVNIQYDGGRIEWKVLLHCLGNGITHWREQNNQNIQFNSDEKGEITTVTIIGEGVNLKEIIKATETEGASGKLVEMPSEDERIIISVE